MKNNSKNAIVSSAIHLFHHKGFKGTSVRDIAVHAGTNAANIAYYFGNKDGLLEHCFTCYYERYLEEIEKGFAFFEEGAVRTLKKIAENIMDFQFENMQLTRLILREMSIDSQVVREIMSTYLVKERYYLQKVFEKGIKEREFEKNATSFLILQLKGMLAMPFLNTHYMREVLHLMPQEKYFIERYVQEINRWIDQTVCTKAERANMLAAY